MTPPREVTQHGGAIRDGQWDQHLAAIRRRCRCGPQSTHGRARSLSPSGRPRPPTSALPQEPQCGPPPSGPVHGVPLCGGFPTTCRPSPEPWPSCHPMVPHAEGLCAVCANGHRNVTERARPAGPPTKLCHGDSSSRRRADISGYGPGQPRCHTPPSEFPRGHADSPLSDPSAGPAVPGCSASPESHIQKRSVPHDAPPRMDGACCPHGAARGTAGHPRYRCQRPGDRRLTATTSSGTLSSACPLGGSGSRQPFRCRPHLCAARRVSSHRDRRGIGDPKCRPLRARYAHSTTKLSTSAPESVASVAGGVRSLI